VRRDDPTATERLILRHRAGRHADIHWDEAPTGRSETAHRVMRLSVVVAVGVLVTGVALAVSQRLHPVRETPAAVAPTAQPFVLHSDPPWTVPLPTATSSPSAPPTTAAPKPRQTSAAPARTTVRTTTAPRPKPKPTLLGPGGDDVLEASLTAYCVSVRGDLAVAIRSGSADGWDCRHAERLTPIAMNDACRFFYGDDAWSKTLDDANPYSWRCFRD
jgi:hypothetical protein